MGYYKDYSIEKFENPPLWENPDNQRKNLLYNLPLYGISSDATIGTTYETDYYNTKEDCLKLTDGIKAAVADSSDKAYFHFTRGVGRSVVFKLPASFGYRRSQGFIFTSGLHRSKAAQKA